MLSDRDFRNASVCLVNFPTACKGATQLKCCGLPVGCRSLNSSTFKKVGRTPLFKFQVQAQAGDHHDNHLKMQVHDALLRGLSQKMIGHRAGGETRHKPEPEA